MRIFFGIFLALSLFFSLYDLFLGNIFGDPIHPTLVSSGVFVIGLLFFFSFWKSSSSKKDKTSE